MTKQYIGFVNDHSGSMAGAKAKAAIIDYNSTIGIVKDAASREMLDTIVSVVALGLGSGVLRQVVISNPHVLKPVTTWPTPGGTPLYDAIGDMIELFESLPDYNNQDVSFLVQSTTDGEELSSRKYNAVSLSRKIAELTRTGRWTFVFRVPVGYGDSIIENLGVPKSNVSEWDTTAEGMARSTATTKAAFDNFYATRSAGVKSSTVFYADASAVTATAVAAKLVDVSKDVSLYVVPKSDNGIEIKPFILRHRMEYLKGSAFYQLTKTEAKVSHTKLIAIRDRTTGAIFSGDEARNMIGLPTGGNARLHPGNHGNFDIFIQSDSVNRKLVGDTGVLYWAKIGRPFTEADLAYLNRPAAVPAKPAVVTLPAVPVSTKPTPSPIKPTPKAPAVPTFVTRDEARDYARANGLSLNDLGKGVPRRWSVK